MGEDAARCHLGGSAALGSGRQGSGLRWGSCRRTDPAAEVGRGHAGGWLPTRIRCRGARQGGFRIGPVAGSPGGCGCLGPRRIQAAASWSATPTSARGMGCGRDLHDGKERPARGAEADGDLRPSSKPATLAPRQAHHLPQPPPPTAVTPGHQSPVADRVRAPPDLGDADQELVRDAATRRGAVGRPWAAKKGGRRGTRGRWRFREEEEIGRASCRERV